MAKPTDPHWHSPVLAPVVISNTDEVEWAEEVDVAVVGFGGAGVCAAIEGLEQGARVMVIDRFNGGGATTLSGGIYYCGGGTQYQKAAGFDDSPEEMFNYLKMETQGIVSDITLKDFCDSSLDNLQWLESQDVKFDSTYCPVKTSYPSNDYHLYYSGNEPVYEYAKKAKAAPRGHRASGKGLSGFAFYQPLKKSAIKKGAIVKLHTEVRRLVTNESGDILGLEILEFSPGSELLAAHKKAHRHFKIFRTMWPAYTQKCIDKLNELETNPRRGKFIRAKKGVVLSAGGFVFNSGMLNHYAPNYSEALSLGGPGCSGAGIRLGESVDGATSSMSTISAWRFINPPFAWAKGIVVNANGQRYVNEQVYGAKLGHHMVEENDGRAILIIDRKKFWQALKEVMPGKVWVFQMVPALMNLFLNAKKGKTPADLARKIGVPADVLLSTINSYNDACDGKHRDVFNKNEEFMEEMKQGPYYAMDISIDSQLYPCPIITLGGLTIEEDSGLVKRSDGSTIKGLYAAGRTAIGVASKFYVSGLSIADCVYSGRRAARHAANCAPE